MEKYDKKCHLYYKHVVTKNTDPSNPNSKLDVNRDEYLTIYVG